MYLVVTGDQWSDGQHVTECDDWAEVQTQVDYEIEKEGGKPEGTLVYKAEKVDISIKIVITEVPQEKTTVKKRK